MSLEQFDKVTNQNKVETLIQQGYRFDPADCISEAWNIFKKEPGLFIGYTLVTLAISFGLTIIPIVGSIASMVVSPALTLGYFVVAKQIRYGEPVQFSDFFQPFQKVGQLFVVYLLMTIFTILGVIALLLPGIYLAVAFSFALPLVYFAEYDLWESLWVSRRIIHKKWWSFFGLFLLCMLVSLLGLLALGVGLIVAIPVIYIAFFVAYDNVVGSPQASETTVLGDLPTEEY